MTVTVRLFAVLRQRAGADRLDLEHELAHACHAEAHPPERNLLPMATEERLTVAPIVGPDDPRRFTDSGIEVKPVYAEDDLPADLAERLGAPGEEPYTRGVHADMYRKQLWTMRQYAG